jgi:fatty-acyl-CoA synthase
MSHQMIFFNSLNATLRLDLSSRDSTLGFLPFYHTGAWNVLLLPLLHRGGSVVMLKCFDPERTLELCQSERISILFGVPTTLDMISHSKRFYETDLSSLRFAIVGGEAMSLELIKTYEARNIRIRQGYGLTEFGPNVFSLNAEDSIRKMGSIGFENFYVKAKIVSTDGSEVIGPGEGELALQGPVAMNGYFNRPEETKKTLREGWLFTGDLVRRDEEGYYFIIGRKKDMYISGGENVYPAEVEQVLRQLTELKDVAVVGVPDPKWGETGRAFIVLKEGISLSTDTIERHCLARLAKYKVPKSYCIVESLPRGENGKLLRHQLLT